MKEMKACWFGLISVTMITVDGGWGHWTAWSKCEPQCGAGTRWRVRRCDRPNPAYGGFTCHGPYFVEVPCFGRICRKQGKTLYIINYDILHNEWWRTIPRVLNSYSALAIRLWLSMYIGVSQTFINCKKGVWIWNTTSTNMMTYYTRNGHTTQQMMKHFTPQMMTHYHQNDDIQNKVLHNEWSHMMTYSDMTKVFANMKSSVIFYVIFPFFIGFSWFPDASGPYTTKYHL